MILGCPQYKMDAKALDNVQHQANKLVPYLLEKPYEECLTSIKLTTLVYRRKRKDVIMTFRLLEHASLSLVISPPLSNTTRGHSQKLQDPRSQQRVHQNFMLFALCHRGRVSQMPLVKATLSIHSKRALIVTGEVWNESWPGMLSNLDEVTLPVRFFIRSSAPAYLTGQVDLR